MTDLTITELSAKEMNTVVGGTPTQININVYVAPKLNLNIGVIVIAGNRIYAPLTINFKQFT